MLLAGEQQLRPNFSFHNQAQTRAKGAYEALRVAALIPRQPDLHIARVQQFLPFLPACSRAVREQQAHFGAGLAQGLQQYGSGAGFA